MWASAPLRGWRASWVTVPFYWPRCLGLRVCLSNQWPPGMIDPAHTLGMQSLVGICPKLGPPCEPSVPLGILKHSSETMAAHSNGFIFIFALLLAWHLCHSKSHLIFESCTFLSGKLKILPLLQMPFYPCSYTLHCVTIPGCQTSIKALFCPQIPIALICLHLSLVTL